MTDYSSAFKLGDRVVECEGTLSQRCGTIEAFQFHQLYQCLLPVVRWDSGMFSFSSDELLKKLEPGQQLLLFRFED